MSAVSSEQARTAAPRDRAASGVRAACRVELAKLAEQVAPRALLAVCVAAPVGFALVMRLQSAVPADTLFGRWARTSGFATSLTVLGFAGSWGLPLLAGILAGDMFASEDRHGTWKTILTRSCTRTDIFVAKTLAAGAATVAAVAALAASSLVAGIALVGSDPLVGLTGQLVPSGRATGLVVASWALTLLPTLVFVAFGLLLSVATRSGIVGVLGPAVIGLVTQLVSLVGPGVIVRAVLLPTPFDAWHGVFTAPAHGRPLYQGALTSAAYIALFLGATWLVFRRRAFAGSESVPQRRWRAPLRAAVAAAALLALLTAASGLGPTDVTGKRLEAAITPTFEHLVLLQYLWRTHRMPQDATLKAVTKCRRGGGTRPPRGPADDWTCATRIVRPQVGYAPVTFEVTLRANGCYSAQGPPAIVGPLVLRDTRGRSFVNPLYAFDGCFGTP